MSLYDIKTYSTRMCTSCWSFSCLLSRDPWFHGPWFVHPDEVEHLPTRMFYHNEVFQSNIQDTNPMRSVIGRCAVLTLRDYCRCECEVL